MNNTKQIIGKHNKRILTASIHTDDSIATADNKTCNCRQLNTSTVKILRRAFFFFFLVAVLKLVIFPFSLTLVLKLSLIGQKMIFWPIRSGQFKRFWNWFGKSKCPGSIFNTANFHNGHFIDLTKGLITWWISARAEISLRPPGWNIVAITCTISARA